MAAQKIAWQLCVCVCMVGVCGVGVSAFVHACMNMRACMCIINNNLDMIIQELTGKEYYTTVALYAAQLPAHLQISCYADLLRGI